MTKQERNKQGRDRVIALARATRLHSPVSIEEARRNALANAARRNA